MPVALVGGTRVKRLVLVPTTGAVADGGNRVSNRENVGNYGDNHIEEVIHSNNNHRDFPAVMGRLEQPVNRR